MKRLFRQVAGSDVEIDAYKLQSVLNDMFKQGTVVAGHFSLQRLKTIVPCIAYVSHLIQAKTSLVLDNI